MTVIVCIDDEKGMMFNSRRQSRDRVVIQDICQTVGEGRLLMNSYSATLFANRKNNIIVDDNFLDNASDTDICFVENKSLKVYDNRIDKLIIYNWNRLYPSDVQLDIIPTDMERTLTSTTTFPGYSHLEIKKDIYEKI